MYCRLCSESFSSKSELINNIKQWENGGCVKRNITAQQVIDKDKEVEDLEVITYRCQLCNGRFNFKSQLNIHFKEDHGSEPTCTFCMKVFRCRQELS